MLVVGSYLPKFGTAYQSHLEGSSSPRKMLSSIILSAFQDADQDKQNTNFAICFVRT
jgi:hypothetical protein